MVTYLSLTGRVLRMSGARPPLLVIGLPTLGPDPPAVTPGSDLTTPRMARVLALVTRLGLAVPGLVVLVLFVGE